MILFYSEGRLGNQIFQYAFLKNIAIHNELIVVIDFDDLSNVFELSDKRFLLIRRFKGSKRLYSTIIKPFLSLLASLRLITIIRQNFRYSSGYKCSDDSYTQKKGLLPVKFIEKGFFQSERFFSETDIFDLSIKESFMSKALSILNKVPAEKHKVFVHVRRGDYINESCLGEKGLTLPLNYYKNTIRWFSDRIKNPFYVFISDDPEFVYYCFNDVKEKIIVNEDIGTDFAIMTLCQSGIVSNSSFSWWGAYLMNNRYKVFAPKYWMGYKSQIEHPKGIQTEKFDFVDVTDNTNGFN